MDERLFTAMAERLLEAQARLEILETAFINFAALNREAAEKIESVFLEVGEEQFTASGEEGQRQRQNLAAVRLGKKLEAAVARRYGPET